MSLAVASDIFRRLKNCIYAFRSAEEEARDSPSVVPGGGGSAYLANNELAVEDQPTPRNSPSNRAESMQVLGYQELSQATPLFSADDSSRLAHDAAARRRGSLTSSAPDGNPQATLRKHILEIQALNLPEHEKARRVQVLHSVYVPVNSVGVND